MAGKSTGQYVMRSASAVVAFWIGSAVLLVAVAISVLQADWHLLWVLLPPSLLLAWLFWFVLYRPGVHYDSERAVVVNMGRKHVLPWGHVTHVHQGIGMVFDLDTGKSVQASGVTAPRRPGIIMGAIDRRTRPTHDANYDAEILEGFRRSASPAPDPVVSTWDIIPLAIGAVLLIAVGVGIAIGI